MSLFHDPSYLYLQIDLTHIAMDCNYLYYQYDLSIWTITTIKHIHLCYWYCYPQVSVLLLTTIFTINAFNDNLKYNRLQLLIITTIDHIMTAVIDHLNHKYQHLYCYHSSHNHNYLHYWSQLLIAFILSIAIIHLSYLYHWLPSNYWYYHLQLLILSIASMKTTDCHNWYIWTQSIKAINNNYWYCQFEWSILLIPNWIISLLKQVFLFLMV